MKAGRSAILSAIEGLVKKDMPRPLANLSLVYTQYVDVEFCSGMHLGREVQGSDSEALPAFSIPQVSGVYSVPLSSLESLMRESFSDLVQESVRISTPSGNCPACAKPTMESDDTKSGRRIVGSRRLKLEIIFRNCIYVFKQPVENIIVPYATFCMILR